MRGIFFVLFLATVVAGGYSFYQFYYERDYFVFQYTDQGLVVEKEYVMPPCRGNGEENCEPIQACSSNSCYEVTCDSDGPGWATELLECDIEGEGGDEIDETEDVNNSTSDTETQSEPPATKEEPS